MNLKTLIRNLRRWYYDTPDRALDQAYRAARIIKTLEDEYFGGQKVARENGEHSERVFSYCQAEVQKQLKTARLRLTEFKATRRIINDPDLLNSPYYKAEIQKSSAIIIEKLNFIDEIFLRYNPPPEPDNTISVSAVKLPEYSANQSLDLIKPNPQPKAINPPKEPPNLQSASDKRGAVPRSILNTFSRIKREIDPNTSESEDEVVSKFRKARNRTASSIKFILLLIIIPLLTHQLSKNFIVKPIIQQQFFSHQQDIVFLNQDQQEEAFMELERFQRSLEFSRMIGVIPDISEEQIGEQVTQKAQELAEEFRERGADSVSNVFADLCSVGAFTWILLINQGEVANLKAFIDELIYGLSDSAKAFLIILFTDMFVGFHSPHGWEVILEGFAHHFGLPESRDFNFLFIATFPVILDTVLKYSIFRYLNRISPSAVATYKTMNE
ncbi:proton extrusion protein PcxA [Spirulina subsalsa]|uniref:proton extrusion protein PcxA n=1 Tax=Spirulina subsalsa TaxID=54311 RepID=UPI00030F373E|nr:proton extrusion protein PcxA [Spirulina subsalsa]